MAEGLYVVRLVDTIGEGEEVRDDELTDTSSETVELALHEVPPDRGRSTKLSEEMVLVRREEEAVVILVELDLLRLVLTSTAYDRRAGVSLAFDTGGVLVRAKAELGIEPVGDLILQSCTE